jgi:hybrid cluster-associated redox disulfide protein
MAAKKQAEKPKGKKPTKIASQKPAEKQYVTKDTLLGDLVTKHPAAAFVMLQYGLHCIGCHVSVYETVEQGCQGHGMPPDVMDQMLKEINDFIAEEEKVKAAQKNA